MDSLVALVVIGLAIYGAYIAWGRVLDALLGRRVVLGGSGSYRHDVAGEDSYQDALNKIAGGKQPDGHRLKARAKLIFENDNEYDDNAVRVDIKGLTVGYLPAEKTVGFRKKIKRDYGDRIRSINCDAMIVGGWNRGKGDVGSYGVRLDL